MKYAKIKHTIQTNAKVIDKPSTALSPVYSDLHNPLFNLYPSEHNSHNFTLLHIVQSGEHFIQFPALDKKEPI